MSQKKSKTDWARFDALRDEDIVYDADTGATFTGEELEEALRQPASFIAIGAEDFWLKLKAAQKMLEEQEKNKKSGE